MHDVLQLGHLMGLHGYQQDVALLVGKDALSFDDGRAAAHLVQNGVHNFIKILIIKDVKHTGLAEAAVQPVCDSGRHSDGQNCDRQSWPRQQWCRRGSSASAQR